jgi:hypothetical protein
MTVRRNFVGSFRNRDVEVVKIICLRDTILLA